MNQVDRVLSNPYSTYAPSGGTPSYSPASNRDGGSSDDPADLSAQASVPARALNPRSRCGRKPFGFYNGEVDVIQRIMELRALGLGFDKLAEKLNEESVRSRSGKIWHGRVINRIVKAQMAKDKNAAVQGQGA